MQKIPILFIVNPISGVGRQKIIETLADTCLDQTKFEVQFAYTEYAGHATSIAKEASATYRSVVAVGGDGTMNEVASGVVHTNCNMGIIPTGSGNGFARHLGIPLKLKRAVELLNVAKPQTIDTAQINGRMFVNVSGIGFDAEVGHRFADYGARGPFSYTKISASAFWRYQCSTYALSTDGYERAHCAFMISFANTSQFGNNAHIAPRASVCDGLIDICIVKKIPRWYGIPLAIRMFTKSLSKSKYYTAVQCKTATIKNPKNLPLKIHIDGEPEIFNNDIVISVNPQSLTILK